MRKLLRQRAAKWAKALRKRTHTVRNWTNEEAQTHLEAAWLAGARSLDAWHMARNKRMFGVEYSIGVDGTRSAGFTPVQAYAPDGSLAGSVVDVTVGPLSASKVLDWNGALLVIPALGSRPKSGCTCVACGWPCNSVGTCSNLGCPGLGGDA